MCSATRRDSDTSTKTSSTRCRRAELVDLHERISLLARPARVLAVALNTRDLDDATARRAVEQAETETGLPADDPVRFGAAKLVDALEPRTS